MIRKVKTKKKMIELQHDFFIESARFLPKLPKSHPCSQTHGHSFKITFVIRGFIQEKIGWLIDYHELSEKLTPLIKSIDHKLLNNIKGLENPTTEILSIWLYDNAKKILPSIYQVKIKETQNTECLYPLE